MALLDALAGGVLIGTGASLLLALNGRIAGISNIAGALPFSRGAERAWRLVFLLGLVAGVAAVYALAATPATPPLRPAFPLPLLALAGILVGYGTALGSGCTSGHGVCGLGRLSPRSLVATTTFLLSGIATTWVVRHVFGVF
jgi:hypothetical protein